MRRGEGKDMSWHPDSTNTTTAEATVEALRLLEVQRVFGLPGIQNIELFDALADAPFPTFTPTNESAAIFMADAYARVTGKLGVAAVTAGPGLTNALTGIAEARLDSSPLLVLVSASGEVAGKSFQLHQIKQAAVAEPLVKGCFRPARAEEVPQAVLRAAELACQGEPGPTLVELPSTLLMERGRFVFSPGACPPAPPDIGGQLDAAADRLRHSSSVGIYAGSGAVTAMEELRALAELLQAPVATTISGRGIVSEDHPLSVGYGFGHSGTAAAWRVFRKIHALLAVGCKYGETATGSYGVRPPREHIHIDINPISLEANYPASLAIASDAKIALRGLLARLERDRRPVNGPLQEFISQARTRCETKALTAPSLPHGVTPSRFLRLLRRRLDRDAILVTDSGAHQFWALNDFHVYSPRSFLAPADYQAMGFSIPTAISAKLAFPTRQVVSLVGDGGFLMSGFECLNAVRWGAKIIVVVFRDGAWGLIKEAQRRVYRRTPFTQIPNPDFQLLAQSFGMKYVRVANDTDIELGLNQALAAEPPALVEVNVDYAEPPPYVKGAGPQMFRNLPPRLRASVALRFAQRWLFPP
jgi:acetolactate synthase-1/2/3 large subunit